MSDYQLSKKLGSLTASLTAPQDPELTRILELNGKLPDRDIEFSRLSLVLPSIPLLPLAAGVDGAVTLGSYCTLPAALAQAGLTEEAGTLLPAEDGPWRYSVLSARLSANARGSVAAPLPAYIGASGSGSASAKVAMAVLAAVPRDAAAADHFGSVIQSLVPPALMDSPQDLAQNTVIAAEFEGSVQLAAAVRFGYDLTWLREVKAGQVEGDVGVKLQPDASANVNFSLAGRFHLYISHDPSGGLRLQVRKTAKRTQSVNVGVTAGVRAVHPDVPDALSQAIQAGIDVADATLVAPLTNNIYQQSLSALESKYSAELSHRLAASEEATALIDCTFDLDNGGREAWRQAVQGDFTSLLRSPSPAVTFHQALLTHGLTRESSIELHLPFLNPQEWQTRLEAIGRAQIEQDGNGRLLVFTVNASDRVTRKNYYQSALTLTGALRRSANFTLSYTDSRKTGKATLKPLLDAYEFGPDADAWMDTLDPDEVIDASLGLTVPGACAEAWLEVPDEKDPGWKEFLARLSTAVERGMRRWLPFAYFADPDRYNDLGAAWPLVVYQVSAPASYDAQDSASVAKAIQSAGRGLSAELGRIQARLEQRKNHRTADFYAPNQATAILTSVARDPRLVKSLLLADALFADRLTSLARKGRQVAAENPAQALAALTRFSAALVETFHEKLKSLYGGQDFIPFGSMLLLEATAALRDTGQRNPVQAILRAKTRTATRTLVNKNYVPEPIQAGTHELAAAKPESRPESRGVTGDAESRAAAGVAEGHAAAGDAEGRAVAGVAESRAAAGDAESRAAAGDAEGRAAAGDAESGAAAGVAESGAAAGDAESGAVAGDAEGRGAAGVAEGGGVAGVAESHAAATTQNPTVPEPPSPIPHPPSPQAERSEASHLAAILKISEAEYQRSALALYNQVCRCKLLRLDLDEQTAILDNLLKL